MKTRRLSAEGELLVGHAAERHGFSPAAGSYMLLALSAGRGRMAQFDHPEFGGAGQWMRGGMTMVGDMFNPALKARVAGLCDDLSRIVSSEADVFEDAADGTQDASVFGEAAADHGRWWPGNLGRADSVGAQNSARYAYFGAARRLAIELSGRVTVYDTLDHRISGFAQRQAGGGALTFSSQHGIVDVATLPIVFEPEPGRETGIDASGSAATTMATDIMATIEKLAELHRKGILSQAEFAAKKSELLGRL